jgi:hypothetical protein
MRQVLSRRDHVAAGSFGAKRKPDFDKSPSATAGMPYTRSCTYGDKGGLLSDGELSQSPNIMQQPSDELLYGFFWK